MVYSTCTFNPIEDEAVVSEVLRICGGAVELVDVSGHLPALKRLPGKHHWRVRDKFRCVGVRAWLGDGCLLCCCFSGTLAVASWVARPVLPLFSYPQHVQDEYHCLICVRSELTAAADTAHVVEHWILLPSFHPPQLPLAPFLTAPPPQVVRQLGAGAVHRLQARPLHVPHPREGRAAAGALHALPAAPPGHGRLLRVRAAQGAAAGPHALHATVERHVMRCVVCGAFPADQTVTSTLHSRASPHPHPLFQGLAASGTTHTGTISCTLTKPPPTHTHVFQTVTQTSHPHTHPQVGELPKFDLPTPYRPSLVAGQKPGPSTPLPPIEDPMAAAREAAAAAIAAAEAAAAAAAAGDVAATVAASQQASVAAGRAQLALEASKRAAAAAARATASASKEAAVKEEGDGYGEEEGAGAEAMEEDGAGEEEPCTAATPAEGEEAGDGEGGSGAKEGDSKAAGGQGIKAPAVRGPTWVRGGGGRGRSEGGKHRYIDPIIPVDDPEILKVGAAACVAAFVWLLRLILGHGLPARFHDGLPFEMPHVKFWLLMPPHPPRCPTWPRRSTGPLRCPYTLDTHVDACHDPNCAVALRLVQLEWCARWLTTALHTLPAALGWQRDGGLPNAGVAGCIVQP